MDSDCRFSLFILLYSSHISGGWKNDLASTDLVWCQSPHFLCNHWYTFCTEEDIVTAVKFGSINI